MQKYSKSLVYCFYYTSLTLTLVCCHQTMSPVNSRCTAETKEKDGPCLHDLRSAYVAPPAATLPQPAMRIVWAWGFYFFTEDELFNTDHYHKFLRKLRF